MAKQKELGMEFVAITQRNFRRHQKAVERKRAKRNYYLYNGILSILVGAITIVTLAITNM